MSQELQKLGNDLEQEKESFSKRKKETEDKLREYAKKRLIEEKRVLLGAIFSGDTLTTYKYVLGDNTLGGLEIVEVSGLSQSSNVLESIDGITANNVKKQSFDSKSLESLTELEQTHIKKRIEKEIDALFVSFINEGSYQDDALKDLIRTYKAIEQELNRIIDRIGLLNNKGESK